MPKMNKPVDQPRKETGMAGAPGFEPGTSGSRVPRATDCTTPQPFCRRTIITTEKDGATVGTGMTLMPRALRTGDLPLRQAWLPLLGVAGLLMILTLAWWLAVTLTAMPRPTLPPAPKPSEEVQVMQGQLVVEVPERNEVWTLQFRQGRYDPKTQVVVTKGSICQVKRKGKVITVFSAPQILVRFREQVMAMEGGVTAIGKLARLKVQLPQLTWDWRQGHLTGSGPVRLDGEQVTGVAEGMEGDTTLQRLHLRHPQLRWHRRPTNPSGE
jgi:hypothetical protein